MKKLFILFSMIMLLFSAAHAETTAQFFPENTYTYTPNGDFSQATLDYSVGSDQLNAITSEITLTHSEAGVLDTNTQTGLLSRDAITQYSYDLSTLGNYNGDYTLEVTLINEDNNTLQQTILIQSFTYSNGVAFASSESNNYEVIEETTRSGFGLIGHLVGEVVDFLTENAIVLMVIIVIILGIIGLAGVSVDLVNRNTKIK